MKQKYTRCIIGIIVLALGLCTIIAGSILSASSKKFEKVAVQTIAKVVNYEEAKTTRGYKVTLNYDVDGKTYSGTYIASSLPRIGEVRKIYYDRTNPEKMDITISNVGGEIVKVFGIIIAPIGLVFAIYGAIRTTTINKIIDTGDLIYAEIKEVKRNYMAYSGNRRSPFVIICTGIDNVTGEERKFKSENIRINPTYLIELGNITTLPVYIDIKNRRRYYVSLEELQNVKNNNKGVRVY